MESPIIVEPPRPIRVGDEARPDAVGSRRFAAWSLLAIVALASITRLYWVRHDVHVVTGDEGEYLRLAENLVRSHAYVGLFDGPQLMYPPLFSLLIAACSRLTGSYPAAGELVSFIASLVLVAAVFGLARALYGTRVGIIAAIVAACHPALIELSDAIYSESLDLPLVVGGVVFGLWNLDGRKWKHGVACGLCFGCAYLTRPEALAYPLVFAAAALLKARATRDSMRQAVSRALLIVATTAIVAAPYVVYLSRQTGRLRLEGKSVMNYTISQRIAAGMSYTEATLGVGADLHEDGPFLSPNRWLLHAPPSIAPGRLLRDWPFTAHRNMADLEDCTLYLVFGPIGVAFVTLGLFGLPWGAARLVREFVVLSFVLGYTLILLGQHRVAFRYVVPLLPFLLVWGANGAYHATQWYRLTSHRIVRDAHHLTKRLAAGFGYAVLFVLVLLGMHRLTWAEDFHSHALGEADLQEAGLWIKEHAAGPAKTMSATNEVPYYAGGTAIRFPYADARRALAYVHAKRPDFIVLSRDRCLVGPYYRDWLEHGIPDPAARLVRRIGPVDDPHAVIYAWDAAH
jgi:4-amino-4-deoxy-L-arabinose transferase-like glycosyltransferase